jgi:hypothetical protein
MAADEAEAGVVAADEAGEITGIALLDEGNFIDLFAPLIDCVPLDLLLHCCWPPLVVFWLCYKTPAGIRKSKVKPWAPAAGDCHHKAPTSKIFLSCKKNFGGLGLDRLVSGYN